MDIHTMILRYVQYFAMHAANIPQAITSLFTWLQQSYGTDGGDPMARADLGKMKIQALRKYTKLYEVPGVHSQSTREDLIAAIKRHWSMAVRKCRQRQYYCTLNLCRLVHSWLVAPLKSDFKFCIMQCICRM